MNAKLTRTKSLLGAAGLALLLPACGDVDPDALTTEARVQPLATGSVPIAPLFDDEGHVQPVAAAAEPADPGARTRLGRYATPAQAAQLEDTLGAMVILVRVEPGPNAAAAVDLAVQMVYRHRAVNDLPADAPVLVRRSELRLGAATAHQLEAMGYSRVFLVTH